MTATAARIGARGAPRTKWGIVAGIAGIHVGALLAPLTFRWDAFWVFVGLQLLTGFGITVGFHRLLAHRSYQVPKWLEYVLTLLGTAALQGPATKWVATHRIHHAFSDRPSDPHSPTRGFWWAHVGWLFRYDELLDEPEHLARSIPDLVRDRGHQVIAKTQGLQLLLLTGALYAWGGWSFVVWGIFLRTAAVYHATWLVNSATHLWGYQTYNTNEGSRNNWWVAILSYGEGWHNNHHAYLASAAHGLRWWEVDATYFVIRLLGWVKLASRIRLPHGKPARLPDVRPDPAWFTRRQGASAPAPELLRAGLTA